MSRTSKFGLLLLATGIFAQVGQTQEVAAITAPIAPADSGSIPVSSAAGAANMNRPSQFALGAADVIRVNVWKNNDLTQTVTVGPDGFVSLPLLGDVHVAGLTANQLAQDLSGRLTSYVVNPQVTVSVVEIRSRQVFVLGQVGKPGGYPLIAPTTVLQVIAEAGGLTTYANRKRILILRQNQGNTERIRFNYANTIKH